MLHWPAGGPAVMAYPELSSAKRRGRSMPSRKKAKTAVPFSAADLANITKTNPYIQRLIEDSKLRDNVRTALDSGKSAYERLSNGKAPHRALLEDKKLQADPRHAADAVREATLSLADAPKKRKTRKRRG